MRLVIWGSIGVLLCISARGGDLVNLTDEERREVDQRIARFYNDPADPAPMSYAPPKFDVGAGTYEPPPPEVSSDPLIRQAWHKAEPEFRAQYCREVVSKKFPELQCDRVEGTRQSMEENERIEKLTNGWIAPSNIVKDLDGLPAEGEVVGTLWSDDYWQTRYGQTSYRYSSGAGFSSLEQAVGAYSQPSAWKAIAGGDLASITSATLPWSPSEKYDATVGDDDFTLTLQQKGQALAWKSMPFAEISWFGLCHGWTPAAIMVAPPKKAVTLPGLKGAPITWYPYDIRAVTTLLWANASTYSNLVGGQCVAKKPATFANGRLSQPECFDSNPAMFHLALGNFVGKLKQSFAMDSAYDWQIWNQPIKAYSFEYFDPTNQGRVSKKWRDVAVPYDANFKKMDRFQSPMTRGTRTSATTFDDKGIKMIVGVRATVAYIVEFTPPPWRPDIIEEAVRRVTYVYDLEIHDEGGKLVAKGGEWQANEHPDFLWIPKKNTFARSTFDFAGFEYNADAGADPEVSAAAKDASQKGFPLCQVVKALVAKSSGVDTIRCPAPRKR